MPTASIGEFSEPRRRVASRLGPPHRDLAVVQARSQGLALSAVRARAQGATALGVPPGIYSHQRHASTVGCRSHANGAGRAPAAPRAPQTFCALSAGSGAAFFRRVNERERFFGAAAAGAADASVGDGSEPLEETSGVLLRGVEPEPL